MRSRSLLVSVCLFSIVCSPAIAGRNANGAMVLHVYDQIVYCFQDPCADYPLPPSCAELDTQVDQDPSNEMLVWIVAAFPSNSSPGVNAYQVGLAGDVTNDYFVAWGPCGPGAFEIPDANWPGAGSGVAVAWPSTVYSSLFKMYWFDCAAPGVGSTLSTTNYYQGDRHAEWADNSTPPEVDFCDRFGTLAWGVPGHNDCPPGNPPTGACCFPDCSCQVLTQADCESMGGVYYGDGTTCVPNPCTCPTGACCFPDGSCLLEPQAECENMGGVFQGMGTVCSPNPCQIVGACCFCDGCREMTQFDCGDQWGEFMGAGVPCTPNPCPSSPTGACCDGERCEITTQRCCDHVWQGDDTVCDPNPCLPNPTKVTTWGEIKAAYR